METVEGKAFAVLPTLVDSIQPYNATYQCLKTHPGANDVMIQCRQLCDSLWWYIWYILHTYRPDAHVSTLCQPLQCSEGMDMPTSIGLVSVLKFDASERFLFFSDVLTKSISNLINI